MAKSIEKGPENQNQELPVSELLQRARESLKTAQNKVPDWAKDAQKKNIERIQTEIKELQERLREIPIGGGDTVRITKLEDITFKGTKGGERVKKELTADDLESMRDKISRLPFQIGTSGNVHDAMVRFLQVEGSDERDLIFVLGEQDTGEPINVNEKEVKNLTKLSTKTRRDLSADDAIRTSFNPGKKLEIGGRKIHEVRLFVPIAESKETQEERDIALEEIMDHFFPEDDLTLGADPDDAEAVKKEKLEQAAFEKVKVGKFFEPAKVEGLPPTSAYDLLQEDIKFWKEEKTRKPWDKFAKEHLEELEKIASHMEKFKQKAPSSKELSMHERIDTMDNPYFQEDIADDVEKYLNENRENVFKEGVSLLNALTGNNSDKAWQIREELRFEANYGGTNHDYFLHSLAGIESKKAWSYRDEELKANLHKHKADVAQSLIGLDSDRAWTAREKIWEACRGISEENALQNLSTSLAGLDSDPAWKMRERLLKGHEGYLVSSLTGLESERAWQIRDHLIKTMKKGDWLAESIAKSLTGINSKRAEDMREYLIVRGAISGEEQSIMRKVVSSLAGVDSDAAWKMREKLLTEKKELDMVARSLAGLTSDRARKMREKLIEEGCNEIDVLRGIYGGEEMVAVRKVRHDKKEKQKIQGTIK